MGSTRPVKDVVNWDVPFTAEGIRFFAEFADKHGGDVAATQADQLGMVISEPIGVVGAIAPWNFPLVMASWKLAPALAAGNAVVLKPSEMTPFSALRLAELATQTGIPDGIFNVVSGSGGQTGAALVKHPDVGKVTFTGSTQTGAQIMASCALSGPKPVTLELGGKSPQVVFGDVKNLENVAAIVSRAIFNNAGQVCVAGSRLLVQRSVADALVEQINRYAGKVQPGPTWTSQCSFSPIISPAQGQRVAGLVEGARQAGCDILVGGDFFGDADSGAYYQPTVIGNIPAGSEICVQEVFGPVLTVQVFDHEDEAVALANDSAYGLAAGVYTSDIDRALRMTRRLQCGTVWVNRYGRSSDFIIPTGGYKQSGIGKDLGRQAYEANLRQKSVLIAIGEET